MNNSVNSPFPGNSNGFSSLDTEILIIDVPGDKTVRRPSPELLKLAIAERERIQRWEKLHREKANDEHAERD